MAIIASRNIATPPRTRVIMMLVRANEAFDSRSGTLEKVADIGVTETVIVGPVVEKVMEEKLDAVVVIVLDLVMNEVVFVEGRSPGSGSVKLKGGGGNPPPPGNTLPVVVVAGNDIHTKVLAASNRSPSLQSV